MFSTIAKDFSGWEGRVLFQTIGPTYQEREGAERPFSQIPSFLFVCLLLADEGTTPGTPMPWLKPPS